MIEHGVSGWLVPPNDAAALAEAIATVAGSPVLQANLGRAARERASRFFTADEQIRQLLDTFESAFSLSPG